MVRGRRVGGSVCPTSDEGPAVRIAASPYLKPHHSSSGQLVSVLIYTHSPVDHLSLLPTLGTGQGLWRIKHSRASFSISSILPSWSRPTPQRDTHGVRWVQPGRTAQP